MAQQMAQHVSQEPQREKKKHACAKVTLLAIWRVFFFTL